MWRMRTRPSSWGAAALFLCALNVMWRVRVQETQTVVLAVRADALAHQLADFAVLARLLPARGAWSISAEGRNHSGWWYEAAYACGARCAGRAAVRAMSRGALQHGPLHAHHTHTVTVHYRECAPPPLLPAPTFCDEWETEAMVRAAGGGAALRVTAAARCGAVRAAARACGHTLRDRLQTHIHKLQHIVLDASASHRI